MALEAQDKRRNTVNNALTESINKQMIYYFSATGNTRYVANLLAKELGDEAVSITDSSAGTTAVSKSESKSDYYPILCFPVHGWRVPSIVEKFLKAHSLNAIEGSIYVVLTCGDDCGKTIDYLRKTASETGLSIAGAFSVQMPESYVGLPFMDVDKGFNEQKKIEAARKAIPHIASAIRSKARGVYEVKEGVCAYLKSKVLGGIFHHILITDRTFSVNRMACVGCGLCKKVCQVENIQLASDNKPTWKHTGRCMTCLACYHVCPRHAISFNGMTKNKGQYFLNNK